MRHFLSLSRIEGTDPLAQLFNAYLKGLSTLAIMSEPTYLMMSEVRQGIYDGSKKKKKRFAEDAKRYYALVVLANSLDTIHGQVIGAIELLEKFFADYDGNLTRFAIENRLHVIDEYGSDEDSDWREDGVDEAGQPKWAVTYKDDPESLQHYTLWEELGQYFGREDNRGEYLGRSAHTDFYPYTSAVAQQSEFSLRKMFSKMSGQEVAIVKVQADGSSEPMTLADHLEHEMNEDITNAELVKRFDTVLYNLWQMGEVFHRGVMERSNSPHMYQCTLNLLVTIRDQNLRYEADQSNEAAA